MAADDTKPTTPAAAAPKDAHAPAMPPAAPPNPKRKRALTIVGAVIVLGALTIGGAMFVFRNDESTDDAQVDAAKAAEARAKAEMERAVTDFDRTTKLFAVGGVTRAQLDNARTSKDAAVAAEQQAEAQLQASLEGKVSAESRVDEAQARL